MYNHNGVCSFQQKATILQVLMKAPWWIGRNRLQNIIEMAGKECDCGLEAKRAARDRISQYKRMWCKIEKIVLFQ